MTTQVADLLARWLIRDQRYAERRIQGIAHPLSPAEAAIIRKVREGEVNALPAKERARAYRALVGWTPPYVAPAGRKP